MVAVHQPEAEGPEHEASDADVDQVLHQDVDLEERGLELDKRELQVMNNCSQYGHSAKLACFE